MRSYSAIAVAKRFLELARDDSSAIQDISNMKLQKLCFFSQLVSVCKNPAAPLIVDDFHAWDYGPVEPKLYQFIRGFGAKLFSLKDEKVAEAFKDIDLIDDSDASDLIKLVWEKFKTWTSIQLSELTHRRNSPWAYVYSSNRYGVIPREFMIKYKWGEA